MTAPEFTGPFTAADWLAGARVRFADDGRSTLDLVKAPERLVYRHAGAEHEVFGRRTSDPDALAVRFRVAPWMADVAPADLTVVVALEHVVTLEDRGGVVATGIVNGPAIEGEHHLTDPTLEDGPEYPATAPHWLVPCWTEREGREATTVYVDSRNVLGVVHPEPYSPASKGGKGKRS